MAENFEFEYEGGVVLNPRAEQVILMYNDESGGIWSELLEDAILDLVSEQWKGKATIRIEFENE